MKPFTLLVLLCTHMSIGDNAPTIPHLRICERVELPLPTVNHIDIAHSWLFRSVAGRNRRNRRSYKWTITKLPVSDNTKQPWHCPTEVHWIDLGPNVLPRFVRSIKCKCSTCNHGRNTCEPQPIQTVVHKRNCYIPIGAHATNDTLMNIEQQFEPEWTEQRVTVFTHCACV